jgi:hypothetical protein
LGLVASFQAAKGGFFAFRSDPLHMQCFLYLSIYFTTVGGSLILPISKVRSPNRTEFTISNLATCVRKFDVDMSLLFILWTNDRKSSTFGLVRRIGNPRYVNGKLPI